MFYNNYKNTNNNYGKFKMAYMVFVINQCIETLANKQ